MKTYATITCIWLPKYYPANKWWYFSSAGNQIIWSCSRLLRSRISDRAGLKCCSATHKLQFPPRTISNMREEEELMATSSSKVWPDSWSHTMSPSKGINWEGNRQLGGFVGEKEQKNLVPKERLGFPNSTQCMCFTTTRSPAQLLRPGLCRRGAPLLQESCWG